MGSHSIFPSGGCCRQRRLTPSPSASSVALSVPSFRKPRPLSSLLLIVLLLLSAVAWGWTYFAWSTVQRLWFAAASKQYLKQPTFDVGILFLLFCANVMAVAALTHRSISDRWVASVLAGEQVVGEQVVGEQVAGGAVLPESVLPPAVTPDEADAEEQNLALRVARAAAERSWAMVGLTVCLGSLVAAAVFVSGRWLYGLTWHQWGCGPLLEGKLAATIRGAGVGFVLLVPVVLAIHQGLSWWFAYQHETMDIVVALKSEGRWTAVAVTCFYAAVWTPLVEELVFRVMIQGYAEQCLQHGRNFHRWVVGPLTVAAAKALGLEQIATWSRSGVATVAVSRQSFGSWTFWAPIVISSLLFALAHTGQGAAPIPLYLFAIGLGFLYKTTGNVLLCVLIHAFLNGLTLAQLVGS